MNNNCMNIHFANAIPQQTLWIRIKCFRSIETVRLQQLTDIEWCMETTNTAKFFPTPIRRHRYNHHNHRRAHCSHRINYLFIISCQCCHNCLCGTSMGPPAMCVCVCVIASTRFDGNSLLRFYPSCSSLATFLSLPLPASLRIVVRASVYKSNIWIQFNR